MMCLYTGNLAYVLKYQQTHIIGSKGWPDPGGWR